MHADGPRPLGDLEHAVMTVLWDEAPRSVRDVLAAIRRRPPLAYTTVMTVLERLHAKGLVERVREGKAFHYRPVLTRDQWLGNNAAQALRSGSIQPLSTGVLMAFLDCAEQADPQVVERLEDLIATRRGKERKS